MARAIENVASRRFTVEEYHRMAEAGIFDPDERVELVRGVVRQMSPKSRAHVTAVDLVASRLRDALRGRASVYQEAPLLAPAAGGYRERRTLEGAARVTSAVWPALGLDVGSLLP